jgi:peptidoglycan/LPS O-acetylase OafA/YrhL
LVISPAITPTVKASATHNRVEIVDLLRLLAALAVVLFHYTFRGAAGDDGFTTLSLPALAPFTKYGFMGVQLFFVISGFVIAYSAENRSALEFGIARIARIYPCFIICMTLTFLLTLALGAPNFQTGLTHWLANLVIAAPTLHRPFMDGVYWSLVYELTFYGWILLLLTAGWFRKHIDTIVTAWLALAVLNYELHSFVIKHILLTDQSGFFAAGIIIFEMYRGRRDATIKLLLALACVIAVGQALDYAHGYRHDLHTTYSDTAVAVLSLAAIALVALVLLVRNLPLPSRVIAAAGGITYPLYLLHQNVGYMIFNRIGSAVPFAFVVIGTIAVMMATAWLIWRFAERPGQQLLKRALKAVANYPADFIASLKPGTAAVMVERRARPREVPASVSVLITDATA